MDSGSGPTRIGEIVRRLTGQLVEQQPLYALWQLWKLEVGQDVAAHARPLRLRDGVLIVAVKGSAWMQELHFMKRPLVSRLRAALPRAGVREIFLVPDEGGEGEVKEQSAAPHRARRR